MEYIFPISNILERQIFSEIVRLSRLHKMKLNFFFRDKEDEKLNNVSISEFNMHLVTLIQTLTHFFSVNSCSCLCRGGCTCSLMLCFLHTGVDLESPKAREPLFYCCTGRGGWWKPLPPTSCWVEHTDVPARAHASTGSHCLIVLNCPDQPHLGFPPRTPSPCSSNGSV